MFIIPDTETKINNWRYYKLQAIKTARHMRYAAAAAPHLQNRYVRMSQCGNTIAYSVDSMGKYHYEGAWLCRDRLCPICAWRLSVKRTGEMIQVLKQLHNEHPNTHAIHVVLTVRNCTSDELRSVIQQLTAGFTRLKKRALWNDYIMGYARSVEVTYNAEEDTYHPHIHVIAIVPNNYTKQISIGDWVSMWRESCRIEYNPIVWANRAYNRGAETLSIEYEFDPQKTEREAAAAAIIEACKYAVKPESISAAAAAGDIGILAEALNGIRMVSFGGIIKSIRRKLHISDTDKPDEQLPKMVINPEDGINAYTVMYQWCSQTRNYVIMK